MAAADQSNAGVIQDRLQPLQDVALGSAGLAPLVLLAAILVGIVLFVLARSLRAARVRARNAAAELERSAAATRASETRFRLLFEQAPLAVHVFTPAGRPLRVNQAWEQLWDVQMNQLEAYNVFDDPVLQRCGLLDLVRESLAGEPTTVPPTFCDPGSTRRGRACWVEGVVYPVKDAGGAAQEVVLVLKDVTARVQAQLAVRTGEEQLGLITDAVPALISYVDREERYRFVNRTYEAWFGRPRQDLMGRTIREVLGEAAYDVLRPRVVEVLSGRPVTFEATLPYADGGTREVHVSYAPDVHDGRVSGFVALVADVSERAAAERRQRFLADASALLAASLNDEATLAAIARLAAPRIADWCALDVVGEDASWRRVAVAHVDPDRTDLLRQLPPFPAAGAAAGGLVATLRSGRSQAAADVPEPALLALLEHPELSAKLRQVGLRSYVIAPLLARGRMVGALTIATADSGRRYGPADVELAEELARRCGLAADNARLFREAQAAYREAQKASRLKDEFLATLSHELRTPLNAIMGWAHLLAHGRLDDEATARAVETISRNARIQSQLISDILDVSRIVEGKLRLSLREVDLRSVVEAAVDTIGPAAQAKEQQILVEVVGEPGSVVGDADRVQQILWNLLSNAVKFTGRKGRIVVRLAAIDDQAEIAVEDDGPGIDEDFLPYVFERFRQFDSSSTRRHGGLGLGLAIVRHLVEQHGGTVQVANRAEGGAVFTVRLPRRAATRPGGGALKEPAERCASSRDPAAWTSLQGVRVLVVDDEADARELIQAVLERAGAEVVAAGSVGEALAAFERQRPDVLLSDIEMPGVDGYAFVKMVRALPPERGGATPAAALTAYASAEDRRLALGAGFQVHLAKPALPGDVVAAVATLAGRRSVGEPTKGGAAC